jgi:hypothetical protein
MNLDTLNRAELFDEIAELARAEGITDQMEWNELVDEVLDSHFNIGELNDDQDIEGVRQALHMAWSEYQGESGPESSSAIAEDPQYPHT